MEGKAQSELIQHACVLDDAGEVKGGKAHLSSLIWTLGKKQAGPHHLQGLLASKKYPLLEQRGGKLVTNSFILKNLPKTLPLTLHILLQSLSKLINWQSYFCITYTVIFGDNVWFQSSSQINKC